MTSLTLTNALLPGGMRADIAIENGAFAAIAPGARAASGPSLDLGGDLVLPGMVDGHMHLDKALAGLPWMPHRAEPFRLSRIETEKSLWDQLPLNFEQRASNLIEWCIRNGTARIRTHVDIDPQAKLSHLEGILAAKARYRGLIDIQIVAFPQSGVMRMPGTLDLLDQACAGGAELVGGIDPLVIDEDLNGQLDGIFAIAGRRGVGVDIHLHTNGGIGLHEIGQVCRRTEALGLQGRVTVSHGFALASVPEAESDAMAERMARAGVSLVTHGGASQPLVPLLRLRELGVEVFAGSDDVRDTWSPYGNADMLERAMLIGWRADFRRDDQIAVAFDVCSAAGARALKLGAWGLEVGAPAHLSVVGAGCVAEAVCARPPRKLVLHAGRVVARDGEVVKEAPAPAGAAG